MYNLAFIFVLWYVLLPSLLALPYHDGREWKAVPLKSLHVQGQFFDSLGEVVIRQMWTNSMAFPITSKYKFSLDTSAVVSGYTMRIGNESWTGLVKAKEVARARFDNAVEAGVKSSLLEKLSDNDYQVEVGPIAPNESAEIEFHYLTQSLVQTDGSYRFVLPTNIAPKYSSPSATNKEDREYATKMASSPYVARPPYTFEVDMTWNTGSALQSIVSTTNDIRTEVLSATSTRVRCTTAPVNGDFSLKVTTASTTGAYTYENEVDGTTYLYVHNQIPVQTTAVTAKKITIVLDRSGSMDGNKIVQAVEAVRKFLSMIPTDGASLINVVSFGNQFDALFAHSVPTTAANMADIVARVSLFTANYGGTELLACLQTVVSEQSLPSDVSNAKLPVEKEMEHVVVLMTDGQVTSVEAITNMLTAQQQNKHVRIMTVGIGHDVDRKLVERVADVTHSLCKVLVDEGNLSGALADILSYIDKQYYTDVRVLDYEASQCSTVLYPAHPVHMFLRLTRAQYQQVAKTGLTITATDPVHRGGTKLWKIPVDQAIKTGRVLEKLYADHTISELTKKIGALNQHVDMARRLELVDAIVDLSVKHGIMNEHTSYLVISDQKIDENALHKVEKVEVPHAEGGSVNVLSGASGSVPTFKHSAIPAAFPSIVPSCAPSAVPTAVPNVVPSSNPSSIPSSYPTAMPSVIPTAMPSMVPTCMPSAVPSSLPSGEPTVVPSAVPGMFQNYKSNRFPSATLSATVAGDGSTSDAAVLRVQSMAALQQADGSLPYTAESYRLLGYASLLLLEDDAQAAGLSAEMFFNAVMLAHLTALGSAVDTSVIHKLKAYLLIWLTEQQLAIVAAMF